MHLPLEDVRGVMRNFVRSGAEWLVTTTFPATQENKDVKWSGCRPVNLELPPFGLPKPFRMINEGCTEEDGIFADKSLGLWRLADLAEWKE